MGLQSLHWSVESHVAFNQIIENSNKYVDYEVPSGEISITKISKFSKHGNEYSEYFFE